MSAYRLLRPLLFAMDAERSHDLALRLLAAASSNRTALAAIRTVHGRTPSLPRRVMGIEFRNPVGLAAGLDKQATAAPALAALGFGFVELGTVTPLPQPGNPRPRMFRLREDRGLINRMGFNSCGLVAFLENLRHRRPDCVVGINIGKNAATPIAGALDDYLTGMRSAYMDADYISVNISSPNTRDLRHLQQGDDLARLLQGLADGRSTLAEQTGRRVPLAVKIAPDLDESGIGIIARRCVESGMDAVIATNTTVARPDSLRSPHRDEAGGLSGAPLTEASTRAVELLVRHLDGALPVIASGGLMTAADAVDKMAAGASLVQLYSGLVYRGPRLVRECIEALDRSPREG